MKVGILYFPESSSSKLKSFALEAEKGIVAQGRQCDVINAYEGEVRAGLYSYLCFCVEGPSALGGKLNPRFQSCIDQMTGLSGKRACVFFRKNLLWSQKLFQRYLKAIEGQGVYLRNSLEVDQASAIQGFSSRLDLEPPQRH